MDSLKFQEYIKPTNIEFLRKLKENADDSYYNTGNPILTDSQYDKLKDYLVENDKNFKDTIGAKLRDSTNRVELEIQMRSMDKTTDEHGLRVWMDRNDLSNGWVSELKLDGVTCMAIYRTNGKVNLYTRGDGVIGSDISYLFNFISGFPPNNFKRDQDVIVRGELIIKINDFTEKWTGKFANARNMVSGCVNAKTLKEGVKDIWFVSYELIDKTMCKKPTDQLNWLFKHGFTITPFDFFEQETCNIQLLSKTLKHKKNTEPYEMDGLIIRPDIEYVHDATKNPKNAIAYKEQDEHNIAETTIIDVLWEVTKWNYIKPRIKVTPCVLAGATVTYLSAHNAKYVVDNNIHIGATITITRSGDVIPKIVEVLKYDKNKVVLPSGNWKWNETNVDIIDNETSTVSEIKSIYSFFEKIGCKNVGEKIVTKLYNGGFNTITKILEASSDDFLELDGFKEKLATLVYENIHDSLLEATQPVILGASGVFGYGFGVKKTTSLFEHIPDLLTSDCSDLPDKISHVDGFSVESANKIVEKLLNAKRFLEDIKPYTQTKTIIKKETIMTVVFSGFRNKELEKKLSDNGIKKSESVSKNTDYVIVSSYDYNETKKTQTAKKQNVKITDIVDFLSRFNL